MSEHEHFLELCADYTLGVLSDSQVEELDNHLEACIDCRQAMQQFQEIVSMGLPAVAPDFAVIRESVSAESAIDKAHQRIFARIQNEAIVAMLKTQSDPSTCRSSRAELLPDWSSRALWRVSFVAFAIVLLVSAVAYRHFSTTSLPQGWTPGPTGAGTQQFEDGSQSQDKATAQLRKERDRLGVELRESNRSIERLTTQLGERVAESSALKAQLQSAVQALQQFQAQISTVQADRQALAAKLAEMHDSLQAVQERLELALRERATYLAANATLEHRLDEVSRELKEKSKSLEEQADLLSHDRDIRDIIAARELYVAEVNDVGRDAKTQEPFGRVFFTKGKSLIFYAYDLDRQGTLRKASTFQAWGRRGRDFSQALPLGIMYLDNSANRRWVLRLDDPGTLTKIDAVFVTVEPSGGSEKPTGKPLLFAYLKIEPNHP